MSSKTAEAEYDARIKDINAELAKIKNQIEGYGGKHINWAHVGSLGYILDQLKNASEHIG